MLELLKRIFGIAPSVDFEELIGQGAIILDVRTKSEYQSGHVKGATNIPLQQLREQSSKLKKDKVIITCCQSGSRSSTARTILLSSGFKEVYNGGSWFRLRKFEK